jgi:hypothetical protein
MAQNQTHSAMLKKYLKEEIFDAKLAERSYIWKNVKKQYDWNGGVYGVPVRQNGFSSVQMGVLPAASDISEATFAEGSISGHKELTMSAIFNERDLAKHGYSEASYLDKIIELAEELPKVAADQMDAQILRGSGTLSFATANGTVGGAITVAEPWLFQPQMKVEILDNDTAVANGGTTYVRTVDINTGILTIFNARTGGAAVDLSLYTTAQNARVRMVGSASESFLDLKTALLPLAQGGADSIYGLTKASYLPLQSHYTSGSAFTASTILKDLLKVYFQNRKMGRGEVTEIWVSTGAFANAASGLESQRQYMVKDKSAGYGFNSITLVGTEGEVKLVGLNSMPNDLAVFVDWSAIKFCGMPLKKKMYGEAGVNFFPIRNTTGIQFVTDMTLAGDFIIQPGKMAIVHSIPSAVSA